jgi:hypothetical protein
MHPLSWNEIRDRAMAFSREWSEECSEDAEAKSFWDAFFHVFGVDRRRVASFEVPVNKADGRGGFIDLLWKGILLVEHKSRGRDLDRALRQAFDYFHGIKERDLPRYVLVSDFARFRLYDLDQDEQHEFLLVDLHTQIKLFGFIAGYQSRTFGQEDPVNVQAAEKLGKLHDLLMASGYEGHPLEVFLVRLLFCLFADDTALFDRHQFHDYLEQRTAEDGSDLGMHLAQFFQVLNMNGDKRPKTLDEQLAAFPFVNGQLFAEMLPIPAFDRTMREALLDCCSLNWGSISPAVFGSLFQSIMDRKARRHLGAHYTSESNILKLIHPLFLDELWAEFHKIKGNRNQLIQFLKKLSGLHFFDPACGCGNFLVIAYRELRLLELEVLRHLRQGEQLMLDVAQMIRVNVDQFYGIEIGEWPARIAEVALWLTDHQMNIEASNEFGLYFARLPLKQAAHIFNGNALRMDWRDVVLPERLSYLLGNPPFVGSKFLNSQQREEVATVFQGVKGAGVLDYVSCWYQKAAQFMADNPAIRAAFVSTNSITQGEQVGVLWPELFRKGIRIHFAHRTFQWSSEARGKAAVHCVIIGFGLQEVSDRWLFDYDTPKSEPQAVKVKNINPYLVDGPTIVLQNRSKPLSAAPKIGIGSQPIDDGNYLFTVEDKNAFLKQEPVAEKFFHRWLGAIEFINGYERWCLWLGNCPPDELRRMPEALKRVGAVKQFRLKSKRKQTLAAAAFPTHFGTELIPSAPYLLIPKVSSERRSYIPIGFISPDVFCSDLVFMLPDATLYHFGTLSSTMHNAWMRAVCGRLESRYRYSAGIVYNNFPWPKPTDGQRSAIETAGQGVLDARARYPTATLADLYDPLSMPPDLVKAHKSLDRAVDAAYGKKGFSSDAERVTFLFERYQYLTTPLIAANKPKRPSRKNTKKGQ